MTMRGATLRKHPYVSLLLVLLVILVHLSVFSAPRSSFTNRASGSTGGCDYGRGRWVLDRTRRPLYSANCPFHRNAWNCGKNKKPQVERLSQWAWVPWNCTSWGRMEPHSFLRAIRGLRVGLIGDSLNENFMVALVCSLSVADPRARKWKRTGAWRGAYFPSFDVTVAYHRAVLLSKFAKWVTILICAHKECIIVHSD